MAKMTSLIFKHLDTGSDTYLTIPGSWSEEEIIDAMPDNYQLHGHAVATDLKVTLGMPLEIENDKVLSLVLKDWLPSYVPPTPLPAFHIPPKKKAPKKVFKSIYD